MRTRRLLVPAVVDALQKAVEEALLHGDVFGQIEALEVRADVHRQPLLLRGGLDETRDVAAQMHARPAPVAGGQQRHLDLVHVRRARLVPLVIELVAQVIAGMILAVAGQHLVAQRRPGRALAGVRVVVVRLAAAVLVRQHLPRPPGGGERVAENAAVVAGVAVVIPMALPRADRGEVRRLQRGGLPLVDGEIGDAEQPDLAVRPRLRAGPFDQLVVVLVLARLTRIEIARRLAAAARVGDHDHVAVRHPALGIGHLPAQESSGRFRPGRSPDRSASACPIAA